MMCINCFFFQIRHSEIVNYPFKLITEKPELVIYGILFNITQILELNIIRILEWELKIGLSMFWVHPITKSTLFDKPYTSNPKNFFKKVITFKQGLNYYVLRQWGEYCLQVSAYLVKLFRRESISTRQGSPIVISPSLCYFYPFAKSTLLPTPIAIAITSFKKCNLKWLDFE